MADMEFDRIAQRALARTKAPSLSIAVVREGETVFTQAFGEATPSSVYNIASVTKQFTAACVLLLAREGKLSVSDAVARWFPDLPGADRITLAHLLAHTSGYPDYYPLGFADEEKFADTPPEEIVRRYAAGDLQFEPGSAWSYSNTGYHIAGLIVQRASGVPFDEFLTARVLRPSGMSESFFNDPPRRTPAHVAGHTRYCLGPVRESEGERAGWMWAAGGIASTARDLAKWHAVLMRGSLLAPEELELMTRPFTLRDGTPSATALGWFPETRGGHAVVQHSGGLAGFASQTIVSLQERCSVVVLSNGDYVPTGQIASELFEALLPGAAAPAPPPPSDRRAADAAARAWIEAFAAGRVDRSRLEPDLRAFLTPERIMDAQSGLRRAGALRAIETTASGERGGMSWHRLRARFENENAELVLRQTSGGSLAEFNVYPSLQAIPSREASPKMPETA